MGELVLGRGDTLVVWWMEVTDEEKPPQPRAFLSHKALPVEVTQTGEKRSWSNG